MNETPHAVIVLGMHRSGTSAVAGVLARLGYSEPLTPLPAADDNPSGFYESERVAELNTKLLHSAGCAWNLCLGFEPGLLTPTLQPAQRQEIEDTLRQEFGSASHFVLKDPRLCITLPAWLPALHAMNAKISTLIVIRHPTDVANSLFIRNNHPETQTGPQWLHHMLEAERLTRSHHRAFIYFDDLLSDWRTHMARIGDAAHIGWPFQIEEVAKDVDAFLDSSARRSVSSPTTAMVGPSGVREMVNATWVTLRQLSANPNEINAMAWLDHLRAEFAIWRRRTHPPGSKIVFPL